MNAKRFWTAAIAAALLAATGTASGPAPVGYAFTYQGYLTMGTPPTPVNGLTDFEFELWDDVGLQYGPTLTLLDEDVDNGAFTVELDFGVDPWVPNIALWLQIAVRYPAGSGSYTTLPRQRLTPTPFSLATRGINVDAAGNVGIGTDAPTHKLHVLGSVRIGNSLLLDDVNETITAGAGTVGFVSDDIVTDGHIGIGTTTPAHPLDIDSSVQYPMEVTTDHSAARAVLGYATNASTSSPTSGVEGQSDASRGRGVLGWASNGDPGATHSTGIPTEPGQTAVNYGGFFESYGNRSCGVFGEATKASSANGYGGYFVSQARDGIGVYGEAAYTDNGDKYGGYFIARGPDGTGAYAEGDTYGVFGYSPTGGKAGYFHSVTDQSSRPVVQRLLSTYASYPGGEQTRWLDFAGTEILAVNVNTQQYTTLALNPLGGTVGIGTTFTQGDAKLHVRNANLNFFNSDLMYEDVIVEDAGNAWLGLYSDDEGNVASGITFCEKPESGGVRHKWSIYAWTTSNVGDLVFAYNTHQDPTYDNTKALRLTRDGVAKVRVLEITGADLAERFPVREEIEPGMVVMIDAEHPGELCLARGAYNRRVAGVVSGAGDLPTGAILGNLPGQEDAPPIALNGRAWVYCDATEHAIEPGHLLTTADRPGYAMAVRHHARASGATLGKAMSSLPQGETGLVLVLVNLQ